MENEAALDANKKETKKNLVIPLVILVFLAFSWFIYVWINRIWLVALQQVASWLANPTIHYAPIQIEGIPLAFLATVEILLLGNISSQTFLANEKDTLIKFISALGLGAGFTGLITIILGIFGNLFPLPLNMAIILLCAGFLLVNFYRDRGNEKASVQEFLISYFPVDKLRRPSNFRLWLIACFAIGIIFFFCFYHALLTVIVHWDSTVYHAVMPVLMYENHGFPLLAGPSIGIEMSANFPPLFSAIGAFYYIQMGLIEDFYLRVIPPVMGILAVLATYKIGEVLAGKKYGIISALFLAITPLFFRYSTYATSYSMLTFFGSTSVLFLFLAISREDTRYWILCGVFYGFTLLTSYLALYLAPFFVITLIYYFIEKKRGFKSNTKIILLLCSSILIIGGVWYFRNLVLLGNPIYPNGYTVLGGINIDPVIMETTIEGIKRSATAGFFGGEVPLLEKIGIFVTYKIHFPSISFLTILGMVLIPTQRKKFLLVLIWPLTLSIAILGGLTWGFPRHITFTLPGFALLSALPIAKALEKCEKYDKNMVHQSKKVFNRIRRRITLPRASDLLRISIAIILVMAFLFPSLTFSMGGKVVLDNLYDEPQSNYLWFLENPNAEKWLALTNMFANSNADPNSWRWLDTHLLEGEKVATIENSIYYIKNCGNEYFFYLDGWEARQLYNIADLTAIIHYLQSKNVTYVFDVMWAHEHGHFEILPMAEFLGTPFFPKMNSGAGSPIYKVGPIENPITTNSVLPIAINQQYGWTKPEVTDGKLTQSVIAGNVLPRFWVVSPNLTSVKITYLDEGKEKLKILTYNEYSKNWTDYVSIQETDTMEWKTFEFLVPVSEKGYVEFALHSYDENFIINKIEAEPFRSKEKVSFYSLDGSITSMTSPPTLMVYLPFMNENEKFAVQTNSFEKLIRVELFEGVIQPWETSKWWEYREVAARSPDLAIIGQVNASLAWNVEKSGLFTLVIVLREEYVQATKVDLKISVGGTR
jgi:hypothetical protein